jgi:hypothetical protein
VEILKKIRLAQRTASVNLLNFAQVSPSLCFCCFSFLMRGDLF